MGARKRTWRQKRPRTRSLQRSFLPDSTLRSILRQIGEPEALPFRPDPFQVEALQCVEETDALVCAPTGSGKTWIALEAIAQRLACGKRSWYASPLKALSNAKYEEFRHRFGSEKVGILTGDRKENSEAPVVVGTTEILRNHLYDAMDLGQDLDVDLVVIDEAHYLSDPERGVVWEEVLIYLPPRVRILMLSATVGNPHEICSWLKNIRGNDCQLVEEFNRPVPLHPLFLQPDGRLSLLLDRRGIFQPVQHYLKQESRIRRRNKVIWELNDVVGGLREQKLLPAIFFLKSRADCDRAVEAYVGHARRGAREPLTFSAVETFLKEHPLLRNHRHLSILLEHRVAAHHAGQLPHWKLTVEQLMKQGHLDVIFSTSTVAAGVDFPARTVVLVQSDRYNGRGFTDLTATELQQMTGRAGRRGKDRVGFALVVPGPHQDVWRLAKLMRTGPEDIQSQIQINFSMVLNLLLSHSPQGIRDLLQKSLAAFQRGHSGGLSESSTGPIMSEPQSFLVKRLDRGRLFLHRDGSLYVALHMKERRGRALCMAHRVDRKVKVRKGRLVLKGVPVDQVETLLDKKLVLPEDADLESLRKALQGLSVEKGDHWQSTGFQGERWLWQDFVRHLEFLRETGFVNEQDRLTADGRWASRLRLDHPIFVAEAIRRGLFEGRSAAVLAGLMAPFVTDREREVFVVGTNLDEIGNAFDTLVDGTRKIRKAMKRWEFPTPTLQFWPAACLYLWAKGTGWTSLCQAVPLDEGDLVAVIVRTADHIRQVCDLADTHPPLAQTARAALQRIQKEPAVYD